MHYVYILKCKDGTLYTGYTVDLERRVQQHNAGTAAKYTRHRIPVTLEYAEEYAEKTDAMQREFEIKQLTREQKLDLIHKGV